MIYEQDHTCTCGIRFTEEFEINIIGDPPPFFLKARKCITCGGLITDDQRKEREKAIERKLKVLNR